MDQLSSLRGLYVCVCLKRPVIVWFLVLWAACVGVEQKLLGAQVKISFLTLWELIELVSPQ